MPHVGLRNGTYDACVQLRLDPGTIRAEGVDDAAQTEVDAACHERRCDRQAHDLHHEAVLVPRIFPAHQSPRIAQDFEEGAGYHGEGEGGGAAGGGEDADVAEQREPEERGEDGVGGKGDAVEVEGSLHWTG